MTEQPDHRGQQGFVLQIDEVGGFLIFTGPSITIGPAGSGRQHDLPVLADPNWASVRICRCEEDYLLSRVGAGNTEVGLLRHGQKVALSDRGFFWFALPSRASTTAILTPVGIRLPRCDIQAILLAEREIMIGPAKGHHIRTNLADRTVVLLVRKDGIWTAQTTGEQQDGPLADRARRLELDRPNQVPPFVMVLNAWKPEV